MGPNSARLRVRICLARIATVATRYRVDRVGRVGEPDGRGVRWESRSAGRIVAVSRISETRPVMARCGPRRAEWRLVGRRP